MFSISRAVFLIILFAAFSASVAAQVYPPPDGELKSEYDRFTDQRKIRLYFLQIAERTREDGLDPVRLYVSAFVAYRSGTNPQPPETVTVLFDAWTLWEYEFNGPAQLYAIVDGERKHYGTALLARNEIVNGKYVSQVGGNMQYSDFKQLADAKHVEMRLGGIEFTLTAKARSKLQEFTSMITP